MKLAQKLNPKNIFVSKKSRSRSVSRSEPPSFSSDSSSSSGGSSTNLKATSGSLTPTTVLPTNRFKSHEISSSSSDFSVDFHFDLVQAFKYMDRDGDGKINRTELETLLLRVGADPLREEDLSLVCEDGCVSLEKFGEISSSLGPACGSEIRETFDIFDVDHDGKISAEELLGVFLAIGDDGCTLEDCKRMIAGVDSDGDGFVCFEDFSRMMEHQRC